MKADRSSGGGATPPPGDAWNALSYLLSGFLLFGGIGWGLDALFGTRWVHRLACWPVEPPLRT